MNGFHSDMLAIGEIGTWIIDTFAGFGTDVGFVEINWNTPWRLMLQIDGQRLEPIIDNPWIIFE